MQTYIIHQKSLLQITQQFYSSRFVGLWKREEYGKCISCDQNCPIHGTTVIVVFFNIHIFYHILIYLARKSILTVASKRNQPCKKPLVSGCFPAIRSVIHISFQAFHCSNNTKHCCTLENHGNRPKSYLQSSPVARGPGQFRLSVTIVFFFLLLQSLCISLGIGICRPEAGCCSNYTVCCAPPTCSCTPYSSIII